MSKIPKSSNIVLFLNDCFRNEASKRELEAEFKIKFKPLELANSELQLVKGLAQSVCAKLSS